MSSVEIEVEVDRLREWLERGEPVTVLDIRPAPQRAEWAIPGSVHVDAYEALWEGDPDALASVTLPPGARVVAVCAMGRTSLIAAERLRERGLDAHSLAGGMRAWSLAWNTAEVAAPGSRARIVQVRRTGKGCLSYVVAADGVAAVVDPSVDPEVYTGIAARNGWRIAHVFDTHVHADHLSRARALAERTGATLRLPEQQRVSFPHAAVRDGDTFEVGSARLTALRTPGHTLESTCYLVDGAALLAGDTLFLAAVGRPDLVAASADDARARARALYRSIARLRETLRPETLVLPCHTSEPIAFDGRPIAAPLGEIVARIAALQKSEDAFVETILARTPPTPPNHLRIVRLNETGAPCGCDPADLEAGANRCAAG